MLATVLRTDEELTTECLDPKNGEVWSCRVGLLGGRRGAEPELSTGLPSCFSCWLSIWRKMLSLILGPLVLRTLPLLPVLALVLDILGSDRLVEEAAAAALVPGC